jgi:hypothetical protein
MDYGGANPFSLSVIDRGANYFTFGWVRTHELFIGRGADAPSYGHYVRFTFHPGNGDNDINAYIRKSTVNWTSAGVTFTEPFGDQVFIPAAAFLGGR